ncbi:hypothetical protein BDP55DRAFT_623395 [Colletotrichum godetiae]|uniref:Uncharacterized protein n=1 Tax=Colletotrichum godetiae TaxID=1209918 RepID=A0AAJ0A6V0_9PEZI|nr:uncharacterized protein BDP55DRAFT_623395 [Colletotrichum godetiae]KAK1657606.1 hypothetical protein BDP55DRAFT_623395 [Colletotrichum godetiae]
MATVSRDLRDTDGVRRREASPRPDRRRRPRLLRASATEPTITTTSNASRGAISSPQSSQRATELLSRVAVYSGHPPEYSPTSGATPHMTAIENINLVRRLSRCQHSTIKLLIPVWPDSNGYFSFPNFDAWDGERRSDDKEEDV